MHNYTYSYNQIANSQELTVIVHGGGEGINSEFIQKIKNVFNSQTTLLIQMPWLNRGEEGTSTPTFDEEILAINQIINSIDVSNIESIRFIGKSIGGLVLLNYIYQNFKMLKRFKIALSMLGFLVDKTEFDKTKPFNIRIIQGTNDKYGKIEDIIKMIKKEQTPISLLRIEGADHSYRDQNKNPVYQDEVIG